MLPPLPAPCLPSAEHSEPTPLLKHPTMAVSNAPPASETTPLNSSATPQIPPPVAPLSVLTSQPSRPPPPPPLEADSLPPQTTKTPSPWQVAFPLFMSMFSFSVIGVPTQQFLLVYLCSTIWDGSDSGTSGSLGAGDSDNPLGGRPLPDFAVCRTMPDVQALTAKWTMVIQLATAFPALLATPVIGTLSDRIGRRPMFFLPAISGLIGILAILAVAQFDVGLWVLLPVHVLQGLMGGYTAIVMIAYSYLADTVSPDRRSKVFVLFEALMYGSLMAGPYFGGLLSKIMPSGLIGVFYVAVIGKLIVLLYIIFILPESLSKSPASTSTTPQPSPLHSITGIFSTFTLLFRPPRTYLVSILFITAVCIGGVMNFFFYATYEFGWDAYDEGVFLLYMSVTRLVWMLGVGGLLDRFVKERKRAGAVVVEDDESATETQPLLNDSTATAPAPETGSTPVVERDDPQTVLRKVRFDVSIVRIGMFTMAVSWIVMGFVTEGWMVYVVTIFSGFGVLAKPTLRSLLSRSTPPSQQGRLFSGIQLADQIAVILSQFIFPPIWAATVGTRWSNLFIEIVAALFVLAWGISLLGVRAEKVVSGLHEEEDGAKKEELDV
ncbi:major facilitator superfamily domain-containing protein [Fimicolochytrium jonesii]|uniref:major facilitator superfamily domain-containing protein n=1 Tax=Fimicolochytrium jonesii TaxID=1396493 RepID=UPI0022FE352B|nr:major facilitator superfamily domain-containing protein [Fimicolochytrium jonesii]KAI8827114.1 major facilitator superfamily domain-containing protein [Fimicolochytrium jonesii]